MASIFNTTDATFEQDVIASNKVVVCDFYADWCMPCRLLSPMLSKLAEEFEEKVSFVKIDTDGNRAVALQYRIAALPTLLIFKGGEKVRTFVGLVKEAEIRTALRDVTREGNGA